MTAPQPSNNPLPVSATPRRLTARAILLGERIDTAGLERSDMISTNPIAFRAGGAGEVVLFRFGAVVLIGLSTVEEDEVLRGLRPRIVAPFARLEDETVTIEIVADGEEQFVPGGPICVRDLSPPRLLVIADTLAKNVALARDERDVSEVFNVIEPFAAQLASTGRSPKNRRQMLQTIGQALLVQQRISGMIEVGEKPDVLWDHPQFERLHARLADEYELKERAAALAQKLSIISATTGALTDLIDTQRSIRLEATIVALIVFEVIITLYDLFIRVPR
ncbi:MAG: RMD1 family protein [Rhizobiales bacterium]|nr:RMD1 family protein [Hyphomicrobiales bacterium]